MNLSADPVQILTPQFSDLGLLIIDALDKVSDLSTHATRIQRPTDGAHSFGGTTGVEVSAAKSDYDYNYKTDFQVRKEDKEFERQNVSRS